MENTLETLTRLGVAVVLLFLTLSVALAFLAGPIGVLKKAGAWRAARRLLRFSWGGLVGLLRVLVRGRRPRFHRGNTRGGTGLFR